MIVDKGKKIFDGSINEIKKKFGTERVLIVDLQGPIDKKKLKWKGVKLLELEENRAFLEVNTKRTSFSEIIKKILSKWPIYDISIEEPEVEEIIRKIYRDGL